MLAHIKQMDTLHWARLYLTCITCCFIVFSVTFRNSYSIFAALLVCSYVSFFSPSIRKRIHLNYIEKSLILIMLAYIAAFLMEYALFDSQLRILDKPAKVLLLIPLIPLLNAVKIDHKYLITAFIISSILLVGLAGYGKYILNEYRVGHSINPIQFSAIAIAIGSVALSLTATFPYHSIKQKAFIILLIGLASGGLIAGVFSQSRGSIIAIPVTIILVALLYLSRRSICKIKASLGVAVIFILSAVFMYNSTVMKRFQHSIDNTVAYSEGKNTNTSSGIRLGLWEVALDAGLHSPIIGIGHKQLVDYKSQQVELGHYGKELIRFDNSHNSYANAFARRGLIGLIAVILFLGFPIYLGIQAWRRRSESLAPYAVGLTTFGSVFFIANITQEVIFLNTGIIMYTGLLIILTSLLTERINSIEPKTD